MCGRYYFETKTMPSGRSIKKICEQLHINDYQEGEVFPGEKVLAFHRDHNRYLPKTFIWGIDTYYGKKIINARSESYHHKATFVGMKPCVIICNGFYEWHKFEHEHTRYYIHTDKPIYLAGIHNSEELVILTGASKGEMKKIHERMPLIISEQDVRDYLDGEYEPQVNDNGLIYDIYQPGMIQNQ